MTLNELVAHSHPITNGNGVYTWDATSGAATVSVLIETTTNNTKPVNISVGNRGGGQAMDGLCEHNPAHKVKIESTATPRVKEVFSNAEIEIASAWFLQTMPEVVLALETGVRRGELLGFFKSDFDTRRHVYSVARTVRKPRGQAPETAAPKSLSYRTNPLTDRALQAVELLRQRLSDTG